MKIPTSKLVGVGILATVAIFVLFGMIVFSIFPFVTLDYCSFGRDICKDSLEVREAERGSCIAIPGTNYRWQFCEDTWPPHFFRLLSID